MAKTQKAEDWDASTVESVTQPGVVKVKCIVHTLPHTGIADEGAAGLGMKHGEVRTVPEEIALLMEGLKQVEIL